MALHLNFKLLTTHLSNVAIFSITTSIIQHPFSPSQTPLLAHFKLMTSGWICTRFSIENISLDITLNISSVITLRKGLKKQFEFKEISELISLVISQVISQPILQLIFLYSLPHASGTVGGLARLGQTIKLYSWSS